MTPCGGVIKDLWLFYSLLELKIPLPSGRKKIIFNSQGL
jgi:hypothetical protein